MCVKGHGEWENCDGKCIICESKKDTKHCYDCYWYDYHKKGMNPNESDYSYCMECRIKNGKNIQKRIKMNNLKSLIIKNELVKNPTLELDLLCEMKRRAALDSIIYDINKLEILKRMEWCLFVMDLDNLKAWNSALGHVKTDSLIQIVGNTMESNINDMNNGKYIDKNNIYNSLLRGFIYRFV